MLDALEFTLFTTSDVKVADASAGTMVLAVELAAMMSLEGLIERGVQVRSTISRRIRICFCQALRRRFC